MVAGRRLRYLAALAGAPVPVAAIAYVAALLLFAATLDPSALSALVPVSASAGFAALVAVAAAATLLLDEVERCRRELAELGLAGEAGRESGKVARALAALVLPATLFPPLALFWLAYALKVVRTAVEGAEESARAAAERLGLEVGRSAACAERTRIAFKRYAAATFATLGLLAPLWLWAASGDVLAHCERWRLAAALRGPRSDA